MAWRMNPMFRQRYKSDCIEHQVAQFRNALYAEIRRCGFDIETTVHENVDEDVGVFNRQVEAAVIEIMRTKAGG